MLVSRVKWGGVPGGFGAGSLSAIEHPWGNGGDCDAMRGFLTIRALVALLLAASVGALYAAPREFLPPKAGAQAGSPANDPKTWFAKGQAALQGGDLDSAEETFRRVLATDPNSGSAYANLGVIE